ncbi:hypothetical protein Cpir12675_000083 [Ceratocystis pirilliformis]|uniref:Uncharacterized protein n=1 Tax=Ceratocystis pirilliformis TaxID=259994 RepID=A0ABR3ZNB2_9PEZI
MFCSSPHRVCGLAGRQTSGLTPPAGEIPDLSQAELASMASVTATDDLPTQHGQRGGHITCWEERGTREEEFLLSVIGGTEGSINWNVAAFFFGNTKGATQKRFERFLQARGLLVSDFWVMRDRASRAVDLLKNVCGVPEPGTIASRQLLEEASRAPPPRPGPRDVGRIVVGRGPCNVRRSAATQEGSVAQPSPSPSTSSSVGAALGAAGSSQRLQRPQRQQIDRASTRLQGISMSQYMAQQRRQYQLMQQIRLERATVLAHQATNPAPEAAQTGITPEATASQEGLSVTIEEPLSTHTAAVLDAMHSTMAPAVLYPWPVNAPFQSEMRHPCAPTYFNSDTPIESSTQTADYIVQLGKRAFESSGNEIDSAEAEPVAKRPCNTTSENFQSLSPLLAATHFSLDEGSDCFPSSTPLIQPWSTTLFSETPQIAATEKSIKHGDRQAKGKNSEPDKVNGPFEDVGKETDAGMQAHGFGGEPMVNELEKENDWMAYLNNMEDDDCSPYPTDALPSQEE